MATVLPKADHGLELQATRVSVEPPSQLPVPPSRRPYGPGDVIDGKYELESLLGKGGMGEVWTARNKTLEVRRAIKLIRADAVTADSADRLLCEAQAAAQLAEPSIVRVFDFGKTAFGDPYLVMEMLEGEDLMSIIQRRERLSPSKAVRVLLPVLRALCAAHTHGIVHRDLKPENIFLSKLPDGRVQPKLLDFGIAKLKNAQSLRLTTAGAVVGSPLYMAPEQARGEDVDERADIWAVCVVLYESITGNPPFSGDDRAAVVRAAADSDPARLSQHGVHDDSLWPILMRGLAKRREDRWDSVEELGRALARWLLDAGTADDVTGASLEATWFRSARQSLFSSSRPPAAAPAAPPPQIIGIRSGRLGAAHAQLTLLLGRARPLLERLAPRLRDTWSRHKGALVATGVVTLLALSWAVSRDGDDVADQATPESASATAAAPEPSAAAPPAPSPPPPPAAQNPEPSAPAAVTPEAAAAPPPATPSLEKDPAPEPARARRRPAQRSGSAARQRSKERRRSQLIDPYQ